MKAPSPLLGFNNNVRHKGRLFHIQTEDSGIRHPHIITHLFADGGRILKTTKTSYAEHVGQDSVAETVRGLMKEQHKAMFIALRDGQFDYLFDENAAPPPGVVHPADQSKPARSTSSSSSDVASAKVPAPPPRPVAPVDAAARPKPAAAAVAVVPVVAPSPPRPSAPRPAVTAAGTGLAPRPPLGDAPPPSKRTTSRPRLELDTAALHALGIGGRSSASSATGKAIRGPATSGIDSEPSIDLDLDALERAAAEAQTPFFQQIQDLPPPPASVIGRRAEAAAMGAGVYSNVHPEHPVVVAPTPGLVAEQMSSGPGSGRYAPSRPASIFAANRPGEGASIFGEDLISEKSLDEVILSYLAEDLDSPTEKK